MRRSRKGRITPKSSRLGPMEPKQGEPKHFESAAAAFAFAKKERLHVVEQVSIKHGQRLNVIDKSGKVQTLTVLQEVPNVGSA
jgi:hypothetical protein